MVAPELIDLAKLPTVALEQTSQLPSIPSIYFAVDSKGVIQYIGRSVNLNARWLKHHRQAQLERLGGVRIAWITTDNPNLLPKLESDLVIRFKPALNFTKVFSKETHKTKVGTNLDEDLKNDLEKLAKVESRSVSNLIELLCKEAVVKAKKEGRI
ncbi:MAG: ribbon-helix-helix domain-containing protein [Chroococcidiopsis sp.]